MALDIRESHSQDPIPHFFVFTTSVVQPEVVAVVVVVFVWALARPIFFVSSAPRTRQVNN